MPDSKARVQPLRLPRAMTTASALAFVAACSSKPGQRLEVVPASAFRAPALPEVEAGAPSAKPAEPSRLSLGDPAGPIPVNPGPVRPREVVSSPGTTAPIEVASPNDASPQPSFTALALVDAKVGDVNGRAIYASEFLAEMAPRLIQARTQLDDDQWLAEVRRLVRIKLDTIVEEELLRAEAIAALPEEARTFGLAAFVERLRANLKSQARGSTVGAEQQLADEGRTLDEFLQRTRDSAVVRELLQNRIIKRVQVGMRDITQDYERRYAEFNPDAEVVFRWIRVPAADTQGAEQVRAALESGEPFAQVASRPPNLNTPERSTLTHAFSGEFSEARPFRVDALNDALHTLEPGQFAGPIEESGTLHWVYLDRIERRSASLYEAQVTLANDRTKIEVERELNRFVGRLKDRASFTGLDEIANRLIAIAVERYASDDLRQRMLGVE